MGRIMRIIGMRRPFSLPLARGVVARRTPQPLLMPVLAYLHEQRSVGGPPIQVPHKQGIAIGPQAREHPKPSAPPVRHFWSQRLSSDGGTSMGGTGRLLLLS